MIEAFRPLDDVAHCAAVVLAGGDGKRIGGAKPQRILAGQSLLERTLTFAQRLGGPVALSLRFSGQLGANKVAQIEDAPNISGPLSGLRSALHWAQSRGARFVLTLPCDAPFLPDNLQTRLLALAVAEGAPVILPRSAGHLHPVCGLWRAHLTAELDAYAASGQTSLIGLAQSLGYAAVDWDASFFDPFFNINTAEDLAAAETILARGAWPTP